jgi:hypothetical protein
MESFDVRVDDSLSARPVLSWGREATGSSLRIFPVLSRMIVNAIPSIVKEAALNFLANKARQSGRS